MKDFNIVKEIDGYIYTIKSIEEYATIYCDRNCIYYGDIEECYIASELKKSGIYCSKDYCRCTKVTVNVKNLYNDEEFYVEPDHLNMVDCEGFVYNGVILCDECLPMKVMKNGSSILPKTQGNYIQLFPCMPKNISISGFKVKINNKIVDYRVSEDENDIEKLTPNNIISDSQQYNDDDTWDLNKYKNMIKSLKTLIYSRLNNVLTTSECIKIENNISTQFYSLEMDLTDKDSIIYQNLQDELNIIKQDYYTSLNALKDKEDAKKNISQKIEELLQLSPREFEEYVGELFTHLGYEVEITQYSNDKGIDIIMHKNDTTYGVQCKRYKGSVGSPELQQFIGALTHAKADKGFFVTTGMFTFEAEKMAAEHPIKLINRIELAQLILKAIND